jgi:acyl-CoA thioester hydrolase
MKKINNQIIDLNKFKHQFNGRVEFSDTDSFQVVHNLRYPFWIEWARTNYLFTIGMPYNNNTFTKENAIMTVHTTIDYYGSLRFPDLYQVKTRVSFVKNSSMGFENYILNENNEVIAKSFSILVNVDALTQKPERINDDLRNKIAIYEGNNVEFIN